MAIIPRTYLILVLVLSLPLQAIAAELLACPELNWGTEIPASDTAMPDHDCCDESLTCQQLDCNQCSQCGVPGGVGAVTSVSTHRFPLQNQSLALSRTEIVTSCHKDVPFKPPRRS